MNRSNCPGVSFALSIGKPVGIKWEWQPPVFIKIAIGPFALMVLGYDFDLALGLIARADEQGVFKR